MEDYDIEKLMGKIAWNLYEKGLTDEEVELALDWVNQAYVGKCMLELINEGFVEIAGIKDGEPTFVSSETDALSKQAQQRLSEINPDDE